MKRSAKKKLHVVPNTNNPIAPLITPAEMDPRSVTPKFDWHHLKLERSAAMTPGGIAIPESQRVNEAVIIASGPGRMCDDGVTMYPMIGKVGDRVITASNPKTAAVVDGVPIFAIRDCEIMFVVEPRPERKLVSLQ